MTLSIEAEEEVHVVGLNVQVSAVKACAGEEGKEEGEGK